MNRTDRLYALVEELRAISPRPRSANWLATRFEVSSRTVERDIGALQQAGVPIYAEPARSALRKLVAVMPARDAAAARDLAGRVVLLRAGPDAPAVPAAVARALSDRRVLRFGYRDRHGVPSRREIEPLGYIGGREHWYLIGWCRLRDAVRCFRLDRIVDPVLADEVVAPRPVDLTALGIPHEPRTPQLV